MIEGFCFCLVMLGFCVAFVLCALRYPFVKGK